MKKILLLLLVMSGLCITGCQTNVQNNENENHDVTSANTETETETQEDEWDLSKGLPTNITFVEEIGAAVIRTTTNCYDESGKQIGVLEDGMQVRVIGSEEVYGLKKIEHEGSVGYINDSDISSAIYFYFNLNGLENHIVTTTQNATVWEYPLVQDKALGELPEGTVVDVLGACVKWYQIDFNGTIGYVHEDYLEREWDDGNQENVENQQPEDSGPRLEVSTNDIVLEDESEAIMITVYGLDQWSVRYEIADTSIVKASFGSWDNRTIPLTLVPQNGGSTTIKISIANTDVSETITVKVNKKTKEELWVEKIEKEYKAAGYEIHYVNTMEEAEQLLPELIRYGSYIFIGNEEAVLYMSRSLYDAAHNHSYLFEEGCIYGHIGFGDAYDTKIDGFHILPAEEFPGQYEAYEEQGYTICKALTMEQAEALKSQIVKEGKYAFYSYDDNIIAMLREYVQEEQAAAYNRFLAEYYENGNTDAFYWNGKWEYGEHARQLCWFLLEIENIYPEEQQ